MAVNMNQFKQTAVVGQVDLDNTPREAMYTCRFKDASDTEGTTLVPGEPVKLVDLGSSDIVGPPIVDEMADDNDGGAFGVNIYNTKDNSAVDGEIVQIAGEGAVVFLNSGAAISRGAKVAAVLATPGNVITATTEDELGVALDKATGANELIRVRIKPVAVST